MKLFNCGLHEVEEIFGRKKIIFFGHGAWFSAVNYSELMMLSDNFAYVIDNKPQNKEAFLGDVCLPVFLPDRLKGETDCIIVLTSPIYMYDMYCQLREMNLDDSMSCVAFPFMQMIAPSYMDAGLLENVTDGTRFPKIPKTIHSFWFSGDKKPESYQRCVDTWSEKLSDYEIKEWNMDNYDYHKHPFLLKAIELKAWAFASDYARLDVLNEYGGIYLDMDVEVFRTFDDLLGNDAILSFSNHVIVDLAVIGAKRNNKLIKDMLKLYDAVEPPTDKQGFTKYFQPSFVRKTLFDAGVRMNGSLQVIDDATIFPNSFFMAQNCVLFDDFMKTENTYCVHYDNFGWSFNGENKKEKKKRDNNLLWNLIDNEK